MALRKAAIYRNIERPYTRKSRVKGKDFIKSVPQLKIVKFHMGNTAKYTAGKYPFVLSLIAKRGMQIRDNAIESSRQLILRHLEREIGDFYFGVSVYPHHVLREHKMAAVAQSDRIFAGMSHAFGKTSNIAAQVPEGKEIFKIAIANKALIPLAREIMHRAGAKIGATTSIILITAPETQAVQ